MVPSVRKHLHLYKFDINTSKVIFRINDVPFEKGALQGARHFGEEENTEMS